MKPKFKCGNLSLILKYPTNRDTTGNLHLHRLQKGKNPDHEASGAQCQREGTSYVALTGESLGTPALKDQVLEESYKSSAPFSDMCSVCKKPGVYRCLECSRSSVFCKDCVYTVHINSLHLPEKWNKTCYEAAFQQLVLHLSGDHRTHVVYSRDVKTFVNTGHLINCTVCFCKCEPEVCTLLKYGLWPASLEKPQAAFSMALLELFVHLSLECQVSVEGFINTLRWKNNLTVMEVNMLYRALVGESISQFRHYHFRRRSLVGLCDQFDDGTVCPACIKTDGTVIVALDANFGLVRKKSSGSSITEPLQGNRMFVRDEDVEEYVGSNPDNCQPTENCSKFKAGNALRSQNQQKKLDITAVFGASCRHEVPLILLNMTHGERLAYPKYVITELMKKYKEKNINLHVIYDIACVLSRHFRKTGEGIPKGLSLAVPAFHVYGHKLQCQIMYSTRRVPGFGLTDGECMERLWSFLRRFSRVTKEMTPSHRLDLLTDALLYYGRRKSADLDVQLFQRWDKAEKIASIAEEEISAVLKESPISISEHDLQQWMETQRHVAQAAHLKTRDKEIVPRWKRNYVMKLTEINQLRSGSHKQESLIEDESQLDRDLRIIERHHGVKRRRLPSDDIFQRTLRDVDQELRGQLIRRAQNEARERTTLLNLKRRYNDGQGVAIRLSKQVTACNRKLKKIVTEYNNLQWPPQTGIFPSHLEFRELCDASSQLYTLFDEQIEDHGVVPKNLKSRAIEALHLKTRAAEEKLLLKREMNTVIFHLHQQHGHLSSAINDTADPGSKAVLHQNIIMLEKKMYSAMNMFKRFIEVGAPPPNHHLPEFNSYSQALMSPDLHYIDYDESIDDGEDEEDDDDNVDKGENSIDCESSS
ncbi:uncharacterized protein LOC111609322 isoform X1 [Xiphophorus maculatus]|uniref:uncharacterized protein LOC111609322 isoform X1 n=2 Tax=Xiphophorus maculatus TaxID=8083 RepID=UPI000C6D8FDF|nr:uncharacterized protein LOC111609322 isoform X1 [Xiphophorus maculatus]XP_023192886.1 uncharacterized protein LOC111609322 isoform X1 [Xiphophorus maculatus]